ncbi:unnamed protein product, partial [Polarella glacialis]
YQWHLALDLLAGMSQNGLNPDEISHNAALSACEKGRQWQVALYLLSAREIVADQISYNAVISACGKASQLPVAMAILWRMPLCRIMPDEISYSAAISAASQSGQWQQ